MALLFVMLRLLLPLALTLATQATPLKIVTIGDSLTDGYGEVAEIAAFPGLGFFVGDKIYPEPDQPSLNPRAYNWPELLTILRPTEATFGPEGTWEDLRVSGFKKNFAVVGTTTINWVTLFDTVILPPNDGFPARGLYFPTKTNLVTQMSTADVVVIFLGGNDLKNNYDQIFNAANPNSLLNPIRARLEIIHNEVRSRNPTVPIVVATIPDVGATPNIYQTYNVPAKQAATRASIAAMNQAIITTFEAKTNTAVARVDRLTDLVFDLSPFHLNGTEFTIEGDPFNPPDHLFCKDNFHPGTAAQALVANEIMTAINALIPDSMTPFSHRQILGNVLALNPDQPFIDWAAGYGLGPGTFEIDSDGDGTVNGIEMLLNTSPLAANTPFSGTWSPGSSLTWSVSEAAERYLQWSAEESGDLHEWSDVDEASYARVGNTITASAPWVDRSFFRLKANPKP